MRLSIATVVLSFLVLCATACRNRLAVKPPPPPPATLSKENGDRAFARGQYAVALQSYQECLVYPSCDRPPVLFNSAVIYSLPDYFDHNSERSRSMMKQIVQEYPESSPAPA